MQSQFYSIENSTARTAQWQIPALDAFQSIYQISRFPDKSDPGTPNHHWSLSAPGTPNHRSLSAPGTPNHHCTLLQFRLKCGQNLQNRLLWNNFGATFSHVELIRASFATWRIHITQPGRLLHVFELGTLRWSSAGSVEQQYHVCIDLMFAGWS